MDYELLRQDNGFFQWHKYAPSDAQYVKYAEVNPSVIAAGHKIDDTYYSFANARNSFVDAGAENFGDISDNDPLSRKYAKSHFLTNALLEYGICLDISWQVIWAYLQPSSFEYLINKRYKELESCCTSESLHSQLKCAISQHGIESEKALRLKSSLVDFETDKSVIKLRKLYNTLKHQGMIHFEGLGSKNDHMMISVDGRKMPILCRDSYSFEEIEELLFDYHNKFQRFFNNIISEIMPEGFSESVVDIVDYISTASKIDKALKV